ncbi:MAG TPA: GNAT family N-acetyltransferase [Bauldia sp.]|nr:GNAT family N-acetyltransferase [Bauldia sp.]
MTITIRRVRPGADEARITRMRQSLWPDEDRAALASETGPMLARDDYATFGAYDNATLVGFLEVGRRDIAESATTSPVGYVEAVWVEPDHRRRGIARALFEAAKQWARAQGFRELGSDADLENTESHAMHGRLGFEETERLVTFLMKLD